MGDPHCHSCVTGQGTISGSIGQTDEPFATCRTCGIFSCGHHGYRDKSVPAFICVQCDPALVTASAGYAPSGSSDGRFPPGLLFESLEEFKRRRPGYGDDVFASIDSAITAITAWNDPRWWSLDRPPSNLPPEKLRLLVAAGVLLRKITPDQATGNDAPLLYRLLYETILNV